MAVMRHAAPAGRRPEINVTVDCRIVVDCRERMRQSTVTLNGKRAVNISELEEVTGQPRRNIRFLIAEQVVPEPYSKGRGASYGPEHVRALAVYSEMRAQGVGSLELIRERVRVREDSLPLVVSPRDGVEVRIESSVLEEIGAEALAREIAKAVRKAARERKGNEDEA